MDRLDFELPFCWLVAFDVENTIQGLPKGHDLKVGGGHPHDVRRAVRELVAAIPVLAVAIEPLLEAHASISKSFVELYRQVLAVTRIDPVSRWLMTVPGTGAVTALAYCSPVDIPERSRAPDPVGAHVGLVPRKYQSGTTPQRPDHQGWRRDGPYCAVRGRQCLAYQGDTVVPLKTRAVRLAQRIGGKRAKVALARKLAVILHRIWIDGTTLTWTREPAMAVV